MEIRRLLATDTAIALEILAHLGIGADQEEAPPSAKHLTNLLQQPTCYVLAAIRSGRPLGFTLAYRFPSFYAAENTAYLYDIEVWPEHRNQGIGRQLVAHLLERLEADGVREIWLGTAVENFPAQRLFSLTGAQKEAETFYEYIYQLKDRKD